MGNDDDDEIVAHLFCLESGEKPAQQRNAGKAGDAVLVVGILRLHQTADEVHFAILCAKILGDLALADDWLQNAAYIAVTGYLRDINFDVERDLIGIVYLRSHVHIDSGFDVGELGLNQRADADTDTAGTGAEAAGGGRNLIPDMQAHLGLIGGAELRSLQDACAAIAHGGLNEGAGNAGDGEITGGDFVDIGKGNRTAGRCISRRAGGAGGPVAVPV